MNTNVERTATFLIQMQQREEGEVKWPKGTKGAGAGVLEAYEQG